MKNELKEVEVIQKYTINSDSILSSSSLPCRPATEKGSLTPPVTMNLRQATLGVAEVDEVPDRNFGQPEVVNELRLHTGGKLPDRLEFQNDFAGHNKIGDVGTGKFPFVIERVDLLPGKGHVPPLKLNDQRTLVNAFQENRDPKCYGPRIRPPGPGEIIP